MKINPPLCLSLTEVIPSTPTLLMGAGPVPIPKEVAAANSQLISHLGESMRRVIASIQSMGQYVFQTSSQKIFGIAGPSSGAMEMAVTSLLWPGRRVLVLNLGTFSARFGDLARGVGAEVTEIFPEEPGPFRVEEVRRALEAQTYDVLTLVQGETSCGVKNVELEGIVKLAKTFGVLTIVDAVCTLSTMALPVDEWGIDVAVVGGQKGLSAIPGISMIAFSEAAFEVVLRREKPMPHWCLDPRRSQGFWGRGEYHYTAPVPGLLALHEALRLICEETLEHRFERHLRSAQILQRGLLTMGLELHTPEEHRLNSVVAIRNPNKVNTKELLSHILKTHNVEISGAFGLDIIRIGQMGEQCRLKNVRRALEALGAGYEAFGVKLNTVAALKEIDSMLERELALAILAVS